MAVYELKDFTKILEREIETDVNKRLSLFRNKLQKNITKTSRKLFKWMSANIIGRSKNPFPAEYTKNPVWPELNRAYAKKKGNNRFWIKSGQLETYLYNTSPTRVLGTPKVNVTEAVSEKGSRKINIMVDPYPRRDKMNLQSKIYNRLFAKTKRRLGNTVVMASNEEVRPIFEPSMMRFVDVQLERTFRKTVEEVFGK